MADRRLSTQNTHMSTKAPATVEVTAKDLQGPGVVACPNPKMPLWSTHPRVFIDLSHDGQGQCPYCGTAYKLKAGEVIGGHH